MTFEEAEKKITLAFGGYMAPKERQAMEIGWELSRAEVLKEALTIVEMHRRPHTHPAPFLREQSCMLTIKEAIEARLKKEAH